MQQAQAVMANRRRSECAFALRVVFPVLLLSFVAAQSSAGDHALGPMSITGDQTIFLHFIGNGAATERPFPVAVQFFDAAGALVASSSGGCPPPAKTSPADGVPAGRLQARDDRVPQRGGARLGPGSDDDDSAAGQVIQPRHYAPLDDGRLRSRQFCGAGDLALQSKRPSSTDFTTAPHARADTSRNRRTGTLPHRVLRRGESSRSACSS
jgi:hypothetical protein